mmetsp:Transcript_13301/g.16568  ORF Transcript_13301/g.16568 Transcript_13301/m.16568 type:complete len:90 (-) Transcript_13301:1151-1420(-)
MDNIKLLYFASAREVRGVKEEEVSLSCLSSKEPKAVFQYLEREHPDMKDILESAAIAINEEYVDLQDPDEQQILKPGDKVAIIPPISGG